jgi:HlyD family secretion protein
VDLNPLRIERGERSPARWRRRRGRWAGVLAILALAGGLGWLFRSPLAGLVDRVRLPEVRVVRVTKSSPLAASAVSGTAANGYVVASKRAALSADTPGRIVEMNVTEGSVVQKGQVVARLYADEYRSALRRAEADLEGARAAVARAGAERQAAQAERERLQAGIAVAEAELAEAQAARKLAELELGRFQKLQSQDVEAQRRVDEARAELERATAAEDGARAALVAARAAASHAEAQLAVAEANLQVGAAQIRVMEATRDEARATLDKTEVRAPFDGIVVLKDAEVGEVVSPNSLGGNSRGSVVTMVDFASLEVQVELPETNISAIEIGMPASIYLDAFPAHAYAGDVRRIWPTANRQKATIEVRVGILEPDQRLRPEMGARVVFAPQAPPSDGAGEPERVLVPTSSVVRVDGRSGVFVLERDVARFREVRPGGERVGRVLIEAGLEGGESIVADPPDSLRDGDRVRKVE